MGSRTRVRPEESRLDEPPKTGGWGFEVYSCLSEPLDRGWGRSGSNSVVYNLFLQSPLIGVGVDQHHIGGGVYILCWSPLQGVGGGKLVPSVPVLSLVFSIPVRASRRREVGEGGRGEDDSPITVGGNHSPHKLSSFLVT